MAAPKMKAAIFSLNAGTDLSLLDCVVGAY